MNLLLDTHTVIWYLTDDNKLAAKAKAAIEDPENNCFISLASYWEIAIKNSLGRLRLEIELKKIFEIIEESGLELLMITPKHILQSSTLPFHHYDPFDRIIISQALTENLIIISKDSYFSAYKVPLFWKQHFHEREFWDK